MQDCPNALMVVDGVAIYGSEDDANRDGLELKIDISRLNLYGFEKTIALALAYLYYNIGEKMCNMPKIAEKCVTVFSQDDIQSVYNGNTLDKEAALDLSLRTVLKWQVQEIRREVDYQKTVFQRKTDAQLFARALLSDMSDPNYQEKQNELSAVRQIFIDAFNTPFYIVTPTVEDITNLTNIIEKRNVYGEPIELTVEMQIRPREIGFYNQK